MNNFLYIINSISIKNKYTKWYISIIQKTFDKDRTTYTEKHHIVPKSFSKLLNIKDINHKNNIVSLTAKEHFICHRLLTKMFVGEFKRKMTYAVHRLSYSQNGRKGETYVSSRHYEQIRKSHSINLSGEGNPMYGKRHSPETREKISKKALGRKASEELKSHFSEIRSGEGNPMYGKTHTSASREKISKKNKGKRTGEDNFFFGKHHTDDTRSLISNLRKAEPRMECVHCGKITSRLNNIRWHGSNCKLLVV